MTIDVYTATGSKKGTLTLPASLFEAPIRQGLMHQALVLQQSNRRGPIAHVKTRGEVAGSTKKLYAQKHTGRARRGSIRSPLLRGGGKAFGPRNKANFWKNMPKAMRHAALCSSLSFQAKRGGVIALESYPDSAKTKEMASLLGKLPVSIGRRILIVVPEAHRGISLSTRNIPGVKTILAQYLNPEDVLVSRSIVFLSGAIEKADAIFARKRFDRVRDLTEGAAKAPVEKPMKKPKATKKPAAKKAPKTPKKTDA
ncbi:MAG: 50S ribosomal protein L4 [Candidatus Peregrinibacteria bacterium]|nr:50S ribosomal protein L4 [Candidatus Peregrinibacteria bacterium]